MKQSKHTPGPWKTDLEKHDAPHQDIKISSPHMLGEICRVWQDDACHDNNPEQIANARLIAAAPELLEALEDLASESVETFAHWPDLKKQVYAAITKAKGEE